MKNKIVCILLYLYLICQALIPTEIKLKGHIFYGDIILFILIGTYLVSLILFKPTRDRFLKGFNDFFKDYISLSMILLALVMFLSTMYAKDKGIAIGEGIRFCLYIIIYFILKYEINSEHIIRKVIKLCIGVATAVSIFGIYQYFTKSGLDKKFIYYGKGLSVNFRITSTMDNPNTLGAFLLLIIFPLIMLTIYEKNKKTKIIYTIISLIIFSNIVLSMSRNAWLGFVIGLVLLVVMYNWKAIILLVLGSGIALTLSPVRSRLKDFDIIFNDPRIKMWKIAGKMIKDHPIFGVGNGNYSIRYAEYVAKYPNLKYGIYTHFPSHNSYLKVQSELGIAGIVIFLLLVIGILFKLKNAIKKIDDSFFKIFYEGFFIASIVFLIMNSIDNLLFVPKISMYFWIFVAISQSIIYNSTCKKKISLI